MVSPKNIMVILANKEAYSVLSGGAHPTRFCQMQGISLDQHFWLVEENEKYKAAFMVAVTACLSAWHKIVRDELLNEKKGEAFHLYKSKGAPFVEKFETRLWEAQVKDIERFVPILKAVEGGEIQGVKIEAITFKLIKSPDGANKEPVAENINE